MNATCKSIGIASDHAGFELKEILIKELSQAGYLIKDFGTFSSASMDYPDVAHPLASAVANGELPVGIAICGSGNGMSMTLNKHKGIRAALCWTNEISALARQHNNANICSLPARFISAELAKEIVKTFLTTGFEGERHLQRVNKINC
ncbi:MAG: ribose 5-phosphate isomerase B [Bacteroidales bacterium]